ncbi:MAG: hypothetical protein FVQ77_04065 [Cytophagales bacterium]|nr:hypothetical protein [Cytophagales bacterium]
MNRDKFKTLRHSPEYSGVKTLKCRYILIITFIILHFMMCFPVKAQNRDTTVANYYFHFADSLTKASRYDSAIYY